MTEPFARAGDWVTTEGGDKVCQVARDIFPTDKARTDAFENWQISVPAPLSNMNDTPGFRTNQHTGKPQVYINGKWVPE